MCSPSSFWEKLGNMTGWLLLSIRQWNVSLGLNFPSALLLQANSKPIHRPIQTKQTHFIKRETQTDIHTHSTYKSFLLNHRKQAVPNLINRQITKSQQNQFIIGQSWSAQFARKKRKKKEREKKSFQCKGRRILSFALASSTWQVEVSIYKWAHFHTQSIKKVFPDAH